MSKIFFKEMHIPEPNYCLHVNSCSHGAMTGRMLEKMENVILREGPDVVLVYGDTNSTLAGALAASKLNIPVAHVESGLRSYNSKMPEEINRILVDKISKWLFCPTQNAVSNLEKEGISGTGNKYNQTVKNVGDVMYDAVLFYKNVAQPSQAMVDLMRSLKGSFYLATVHRAENTDSEESLKNIFYTLGEIASKEDIIIPLHPRTTRYIEKYSIKVSKIKVIQPIGYFDMISILENCKAVITDSGGLQKEAFFFRKPCITLRNETEWIELVESRFNVLTGSDPEKIFAAVEKVNRPITGWDLNLYGKGDASSHIINTLTEAFK